MPALRIARSSVSTGAKSSVSVRVVAAWSRKSIEANVKFSLAFRSAGSRRLMPHTRWPAARYAVASAWPMPELTPVMKMFMEEFS